MGKQRLRKYLQITSDKGLEIRIYKELSKSIRKQTAKWAKD